MQRTGRLGRIGALLTAALGVIAVCGRASAAQGTAGPQRPVLRVAYFIPSNRKAAADYGERLDRVLTEVQRFYREGMRRNGHGSLTFAPDRDESGRLRIFVVRAPEPMRAYGRNDSDKVRRIVKAALAREGVDLDRETVVIFQRLLAWEGNKAVEIGPYVGGGSANGGTAWVYDDEKLDPRLLGSTEPGGYYAGAPCSLGAFNTHYIGGVAHELGHAFGLPHDRERAADRDASGLSLMGGGNHTYGREKRGEKPGAFLSAASALPLSHHPLFTGRPNPSGTNAPVALPCRLTRVTAAYRDGVLSLSGHVETGAARPAKNLVAYNDPEEIPADYDAVGWTAPIQTDGAFHLEIGELTPGRRELRLRAYRDDGAFGETRLRYRVAPDGRPDLQALLEEPLLAEAAASFAGSERRQALREVTGIRDRLVVGSVSRRKAEHLLRLLSPPPSPPLLSVAKIPADRRRVLVSALKAEESVVGWGRPLRDQALTEGGSSPFLEVGGVFFETGLFAHAPARHVVSLGRRWSRFTAQIGLQDGHGGSTVFVVRGDGRALFRSEVVRDHQARRVDIDVSGVDRLELHVEDAGDGPNSDWGVWLEPELHR